MSAPQRNPIVSASVTDRTGTAGIRRRARAQISRRFDGLQADVLALFDRIPVYVMNDVRSPEVRYGLTPEQLAGISEELQETVQRWLAQEREPDGLFWWQPFQEEAAQLGTAQSVANLSSLSTVYAAARSLEAVIYSQPYRTRIAMAKFRSYEHWTGLAAEQRQKLAQVIGRAVADGQSPRAARTAIQEVLDVGKSRARLYAQTDIPGTLREARLAESDHARDELGIRTGLLWTSAFLPTTRPWHAARSGQAYTSDQVRAFYAEGGNRYNCFCSCTECLLDADGKPIRSKKLQSTMANEKRAWQAGRSGPVERLL